MGDDTEALGCEHGFIAGCPECSRPSVQTRSAVGKTVQWAVCSINDRGEPYIVSYPQDHMGQQTKQVVCESRHAADRERANLQHSYRAPLYLGKVTTVIELDVPRH